MFCAICHQPIENFWLCKNCHEPYERLWMVGERKETLQRLIGLYKFERAYAAYECLGDLLLGVLPELPKNTIIVPVPTTPGRIRERGYDHMLKISRYVARARNLECKKLIKRVTDTKQRQATAGQREIQARQAFKVDKNIDKEVPYLVIDDVFTTGSTIKYASKALRDAGAKHVWAAVIAYQSLK